LRDLGVEIKASDFQTASPGELDELLEGVDTLISAPHVTAEGLLAQRRLVDAVKRTGVNRFIPCDWGPSSPRGIMDLHDLVGFITSKFIWFKVAESQTQKYQIHDYIKEQQIPYTIIDVGFWMQISLPHRSSSTSPLAPLIRTFFGDGEKKSALINREHIGNFVARIISDPRTLNQYVFAYEVEVNQNEIYEVSSRIAGEDFRKIHSSVRTFLLSWT
jgi:hypothetical protein